MENEVKQRTQRNRRRERAQRMQAQKRENKVKNGGADSGEDESPTREKPQRPPPPSRRKKSKDPLFEEDVVDGFAVLSFKSYEDLEDKVIGEMDAKIMVGVIDYDMPQQYSKQETTSQEIHVHPRFWNLRLAKFDVALVKVRDKFDFNDWVTNIQISGEEWPQPISEMNNDLGMVNLVNDTLNCMWIGFGGYATTSLGSTKLKQRNVTAAHGDSACPCTISFQAKRLVCVKDTLHAMTCKGDDGGPLICDNIVRAIVHMVSNRAQCENPTYPLDKCYGGAERGLTSFMFLCPLNDWLHSIVDEIPPRPATCRAPSAPPHFALLCASVAVLASLPLLIK